MSNFKMDQPTLRRYSRDRRWWRCCSRISNKERRRNSKLVVRSESSRPWRTWICAWTDAGETWARWWRRDCCPGIAQSSRRISTGSRQSRSDLSGSSRKLLTSRKPRGRRETSSPSVASCWQFHLRDSRREWLPSDCDAVRSVLEFPGLPVTTRRFVPGIIALRSHAGVKLLLCHLFVDASLSMTKRMSDNRKRSV